MNTVRSHTAASQRILYLLTALVVLVIADGVITNILIEQGLAREGNPLLQGLAGSGSFLVIKAAGALLSALILANVYTRRARLAQVSTCCLLAFYGGIVCWNLLVLLLVRP